MENTKNRKTFNIFLNEFDFKEYVLPVLLRSKHFHPLSEEKAKHDGFFSDNLGTHILPC